MPLIGCSGGPSSLLVSGHVGHSSPLVGGGAGPLVLLAWGDVGCLLPVVLGPQCCWHGGWCWVIVAIGRWWCWALGVFGVGGGVGHPSPFAPFAGGVLSWSHHHHILVSLSCHVSCCHCGVVVICCSCGCSQSLLSSVVCCPKR